MLSVGAVVTTETGVKVEVAYFFGDVYVHIASKGLLSLQPLNISSQYGASSFALSKPLGAHPTPRSKSATRSITNTLRAVTQHTQPDFAAQRARFLTDRCKSSRFQRLQQRTSDLATCLVATKTLIISTSCYATHLCSRVGSTKRTVAWGLRFPLILLARGFCQEEDDVRGLWVDEVQAVRTQHVRIHKSL